MSDISIVIGSWGSYNECNERALGSKWLKISEYTDWKEIEMELKQQGFILDGVDEELFIQDIDNMPSDCANWDYIHPKTLFETLQESGVLEDDFKCKIMAAFIEVKSYDEFAELVSSKGCNWDDDIMFYPDFDWQDFGREMFDCCGYKIDEHLLDFFDFEAYGEYLGSDYAYEYDGIIEIIN